MNPNGFSKKRILGIFIIILTAILVSSSVDLAFAAPDEEPGQGNSPQGRPFLSIQDQLEQVNIDTEQLRLRIVENEVQISLLLAEDENLQDQIDAINEDIRSLQGEIDANDAELDSLFAIVRDLQAQITANDADIKALQIFVRSLQAQIDANDAEIIDLQAQITANDADIRDLQAQIFSNDSDIELLQLTARSLQAQIDSNDEDISSLQSQIADNDAELDSLFTIVRGLQDQIDANAGDIVDLQAQIDAKMRDIRALQLRDEFLQAQINENDRDNLRLQGEIDANDADISRLVQATRTIQTEIVALQLTDRLLRVQLDANNADNRRLQGEIDNIINVEIVALQLTGVSLQTQLDANDADISRLVQATRTIQTEIVALELTSVSLQSQITANDREIARLQSQNRTIEGDIRNLLRDVTELERVDRILLGLIGGLSDRVDSFFDILQRQIFSNDADIAALERKTIQNMRDIQAIDVSSLERRLALVENAVSILNIPPIVSAGPDKIVRFVNIQSTTLDGSASDEGILLPLVTTWTLESSTPLPGDPPIIEDPVIVDPSSPSTGVTFTEIGTYVFRLSAFDGLVTVFDEVTVTVFPNTEPTVDAGVPFVFTGELSHRYGDGRVLLTASSSNAYLLRGSVSDPDAPEQTLTIIGWSKFSGPGTATFTPVDNPSSSVEFGAVGEYVLRLTATDGLETSSDDITFNVLADHNPPNVSVIGDQSQRGTDTTKTILGVTRTGPSCNFDIPAINDDGPDPLNIQWEVRNVAGFWFGASIDGTESRSSRHTINSGDDPTLLTFGTQSGRSHSISYFVTADDGFYSQSLIGFAGFPGFAKYTCFG